VEIVLVRHAQPDWEPSGIAQDNPGLTPLGHRQASLTAEALAGEHFDAVYSSPLQRVVETSAPIVAALDMEPKMQPWLREIGLPAMEGMTSEQVAAYFEGIHERDLERWWDGFPGGESFRHFYERVSGGIEGLLSGEHRLGIHEDSGHRLWQMPDALERVLIVAHEGTIGVLLSHLLGIEPVPWAHTRFSSAWTGISRIESLSTANGALWVLESFNRIDHLSPLREETERSGRMHSS
jgi:probable phosphoglycerate mutase